MEWLQTCTIRARRKGSDDDAAAAAMREVSSIATIPIESGFIPAKVLHIPLKAILSIFIAAVELNGL
jgi:hypothetical protein